MNFISRNGSHLLDNNVKFRFISFNIPNLFIIEDPYWHQSTLFEQTDALASIREMGGRVVRVYPFSFQKDINDYPRHFLFSDGKWILNEILFSDVDRALAVANANNIRVIIPFIDRWDYWGGIPTFELRNNLKDSDFFTNSMLRNQFKEVLSIILNRVNSLNGIKYKNDPTILAWETGNELDYLGSRVPSEWTLDITKYIKSLDTNHLIIDGSNGALGWDNSVLSDSNIDIYSNHYYTRLETKQLVTLIVFPILWIIVISIVIKSMISFKPQSKKQVCISSASVILILIGFILSVLITPIVFPDISTLYLRDDILIRSFDKILLVGELGLHKWTEMDKLLTEFIPRVSSCGVLLWSLRSHSESGGFCKFKY